METGILLKTISTTKTSIHPKTISMIKTMIETGTGIKVQGQDGEIVLSAKC
jgi:hypothetical protein